MQPWYATREDVKAALDVKETARSNSQIDRVLASSSRGIEGDLHRRFYPELKTVYFDWPNQQYARSWRLWLDANELVSATSIVVAGVTLSPSDYFLRRSDGRDEPPYTHIEIDLSSSAAFGAGSTHQRAIAITGVFGHRNDEDPGGATAEVLDASETAVDVTDSSAVGVGSLLRVDDERLIVTERNMLDTTADITFDLTASAADVLVGVPDGEAFTAGEAILVDAERMLIIDIAGDSLIVKRAWDGSVLATHDGGADIYASRRLTVVRGALGTTAATHLTAAPLYRFVYPPLVSELGVAESLNSLLQRQSGYARTVGSGESEREASGRGLRDIRAEAYTAYGRKARKRAV